MFLILATKEAEIRRMANTARDPILKKPSQQRADRVAQGVGPEFKPLYCKKKKKKKSEDLILCNV
jgi:hypothetical protein